MPKPILPDNFTAEDLLALMPLVSDEEWGFEPSEQGRREIRNRDGKCPICALAAKLGDGEEIEEYDLEAHAAMAQLLHRPLSRMEGNAVDEIMSAADFTYPLFRRRLMAALGMVPDA